MSTPAIEAVRLGKRYRRGARVLYRTLREDLTLGVRRLLARGGAAVDDARWIWALRDLDLRVEPGELLGVIGSNGAGKSTLLKLLAGITDPSAGHADLDGRVGSLLEVGTGFHMELTGRENIFLSGAILGMRRDEIQKSFDAIVDFAGVEDFLDTPVKHFSSGMHTRLGFAVAAHLTSEILLVDEVLAVGDAAFQRRCLGRMGELAGQGRTVLFVSHNLASVQALCGRAIRLEQGRLVDDGEVGEVVRRYLQSLPRVAQTSLRERTDRSGGEQARLVAVHITSDDPGGLIYPMSKLTLRVDFEAHSPLQGVSFVASVYDAAGTGLFALESEASPEFPERLPAQGRVTCQTGPLRLTPGRCHVNLRMSRAGATLDWVPRALEFDIEPSQINRSGRVPGREWATTLVDNQWSVE